MTKKLLIFLTLFFGIEFKEPIKVEKIENYKGFIRTDDYHLRGNFYKRTDINKEFTQEGIASFYGKKVYGAKFSFHGRKTANGEIFDENKMTCAHQTLPLPAYVKVTNLDNGKEVILRCNDTGHFRPGRVIDVSKGAAKKLDFVNKGLTKVKVEYLKDMTHEFWRVHKLGQYKNK